MFYLSIIFSLIISQTLLSLPKNSHSAEIKNLAAYAIAQDPLLKGVSIIADDKTDTLYVSPSSKKTQSGVFNPIAMPACDTMNDHYELTYLMPNVSERRYVEFAKKGPYSPFFDYKLGNYVRHMEIINSIMQKYSAITEIEEQNSELIKNFTEIKLAYDEAQKEYEIAQAAYKELSKRIASLTDQLSSTNDAKERDAIMEEVKEARKIKREEKKERRERYNEARKKLNRLTPKYAKIRAQLNSTVPNLSEDKNKLASLTAMFDTINKLSLNTFAANEKGLEAFENTTVGVASASYSVWANEEASLREVLTRYAQRGPYFEDYQVARLPIHNIRIKKPQNRITNSSISGNFNGNTSTKLIGTGFTSDSLAITNDSHFSTNPIFTKDSLAVRPEIKTLAHDGADNFGNPITRGTFCTGSSKRYGWDVETIIKQHRKEDKIKFTVYGLKPRQSNLLAQSVALEYEYFVRTDPIAVRCQLNITDFKEKIIDTGSSGFLFWRKDWDESELNQIKDSGLSCELLMSPAGEYYDLEGNRNRLESIRQAMIQEVAAEFILTYAKSWETVQQPTSIPTKKDDAVIRAGVALGSLCGTNMYCAIGSIVLKSGKELFGAQFDNTRHKNYLQGIIRRSYEENSWTVKLGHAVIDVVVTL